MSSTEPGPRGPIVLLGPQLGYREIKQVLDELDVEGDIALITAGWQENEGEFDALAAQMGRPAFNVALHERTDKVFAADPEFAEAATLRQKHLQHLQSFYRVRLDAIDDAAGAIAVRHVKAELLEEQRQISVAQLRHLDCDHLARCTALQDEFDETWKPATRPAIASHREAVAAQIERSAAVVVAGGHVVALLNRLRLFDAFARTGDRPIIAWSAGAMTLTDRIVLFHDFPPFGKNLAQLVDTGLGLCPDVVVLPDMARRVRLDNRNGIGRFAQRMAPAACLALDPGSQIVFQDRKILRAQTACLTASGIVEQEWTP
ncbi:MAG: hypothetical protein ACNA8W_08640 [Bradymonadaceae bacterium]